MGKRKDKIINEGCRLYNSGYKRTKVKEFLSSKSKRTSIGLTYKHEITTVNGFPINRNGKLI